MKYYFLASYLPDINRDDTKIRVSVTELLEERFHIPEADLKEIDYVLLESDIVILENLLSGRSVVLQHSIFDIEFWKDQIKSPQDGPEFLQDFLHGLDQQAFGPKQTDALYAAYFDYVLTNTANDFLRGYYTFLRDVRNLLAALRARRKGLDPLEHIIGDGELLDTPGKASAEDFGLSGEYPWLEPLLKAESPAERQELIEQVLWDYLDENAGPDPFSFNAILAYLLKLVMLDKRLALSEEKGMEKVHRLGGF